MPGGLGLGSGVIYGAVVWEVCAEIVLAVFRWE